LEVSQGHRIIEVGCVELVNRKLTGNHFHHYVNPQRDIDQGAIEVHGITPEFLADKPLFGQIASDFVDYVRGAELIIHNAPFDLGFLSAELDKVGGFETLKSMCTVVDSLTFARTKHPGQRNTLDALCQRYGVDNSQRELHGALLDAEILADVYLAMTGGQTTFELSDDIRGEPGSAVSEGIRRLPSGREPLPVVYASERELVAHEFQLDVIAGACEGEPLWRTLDD